MRYFGRCTDKTRASENLRGPSIPRQSQRPDRVIREYAEKHVCSNRFGDVERRVGPVTDHEHAGVDAGRPKRCQQVAGVQDRFEGGPSDQHEPVG